MEEGNGRLVEVAREYWEAISGGVTKVPAASTSRGRERMATKKGALLRDALLPPNIIVWSRNLMKLNIHRSRGDVKYTLPAESSYFWLR